MALTCLDGPAVRSNTRHGAGSAAEAESVYSHPEHFRTTGLMVTERNWLEVYHPYESWKGRKIPVYREGEVFSPTRLGFLAGRTEPPPLLSEDELIAQMDREGIGTDATMSSHIKTVLERGYAERVGAGGRHFSPTLLGQAMADGFDEIGDMHGRLMHPVLRRQMELSRRRRDAVTEWTPPKEKRTKARRKPALPRFDTKKDNVDPSKPVSSPARLRTATVDVNAALPVFSNAVSRALASCAVDEGDQARYLNERGDKTKTNPRATVAMVEDVPALSAVRGPGTPYANVPAHKRYSWYKHYGFGGKGAKTSWGYNPKRGDIGARYESAKSQPAKCTACPAEK